MIGVPVRQSQRQTEKFTRQPAPTGGIDNRVALSQNNPNVCIYTYNLIPSEYGMQLRNGYREWVTDIETAPGLGLGVNTIIPYEGSTEGPADDRLFAVTNEGIWNVTTHGQVPTLMTDPGDWTLTSPDAGWGTYCHYITDADETILFYADTINGLFQYRESTGLWSRPIGITGPVVENINFVVVHKLRIWFGEENSAKTWYLPIKSFSGAASPFTVSGKFKHGGLLAGIYNWTVDGGDGVDDYLVFISTAGDVIPYRGSDPTQAGWTLVGSYFVGALGSGGRAVQQDGGNMNILSNYGITSMSDLLRGVDPRLPNQDSIGSKVTELIRDDMRNYRNDLGWDIKTLAPEGALAVITPKRLDGTYLQYIYNKAVGGWGLWRGMPFRCCDVWENYVRFGSEDNKVYVMDAAKDNIKIGTTYLWPIESVVDSFSSFTGQTSDLSIYQGDLFSSTETLQTATVYQHTGISGSGSSLTTFTPAAKGIAVDFSGNLVSLLTSETTITRNVGLSNTPDTSFVFSHDTVPERIDFIDDDLIVLGSGNNKIYRMTGFSDILLLGIDSPSPNVTGICWDGTNLITCQGDGVLNVHDGFSETILYSFQIELGATGVARRDTNLVVTYAGVTSGLIQVFGSQSNIPGTSPSNANGSNIEFSIMFNYHDLGEPAVYKEGTYTRPDFISLDPPSYETKFFYDYATSEILTTPNDAAAIQDVWDASNWDQAIWGSSKLGIFSSVFGGSGRGRYVTVAIKGNGVGGTNLQSCDIFYQSTGPL